MDAYNHRIRTISSSGVVSTLAGDGVKGYADSTDRLHTQSSYPKSVAVGANAFFYVADAGKRWIRTKSPTGQESTQAEDGTRGYTDSNDGTSTQFSTRIGVAAGAKGVL